MGLEWRMTPESGCTYGIREGMIIRNTFLEFGPSSDQLDNDPVGDDSRPLAFRFGSADLTEAQRHLPRRACRVRARSCPVEAFEGEVDLCQESSLDTTRSPSTEAGADADDWQGSTDAQAQGAPVWQRWHADSGKWPASAGFGQSAKSGGRGKKGGQQAQTNHQTLVLRGLPFHVSERELRQFLESSGVGQDLLAHDGAVTLLSNSQGRPSGFAEVTLAPGADFSSVKDRLHMRRLGGRYIEALPPRAGKHHGGRGRGSWRR